MFADILRKIREAADAFGMAARGELNTTNAVMWQHKMLSFADGLDKPAYKRDSPYFPGQTNGKSTISIKHQMECWLLVASIGTNNTKD